MSRTTVSKTEWTEQTDDGPREREQYKTTIPKPLAEAMEIEDGAKVEWTVKGANAFRVEVVEDAE